LHTHLDSQLISPDVPFLLVILASLPHTIRDQIPERARPFAARLDAPKVLHSDITSFFVRSTPQHQVLLLFAPIGTGVARIVSAGPFVLYVNISRLFVFVAVKRNIVVFIAEKRLDLAAFKSACLVHQVDMIGVLVLKTE
jgi:hypothetical protein